MAQGLLGGVLPAIYSGANQLKRGVYGLLTNPMQSIENTASGLIGSHLENVDLWKQAHGNPNNPLEVTNKNALNMLGDRYLNNVVGFAPAGITAFHGTPHNILGKFDINKVGTGEGAQSYGHGMYFAENPKVAASYQENVKNREGIKTLQDQILDLRAKQKVSTTREESDSLLNAQNTLIEQRNAIENAQGNLYKVDIPDAYIPTMMDFYKPLGEQSDFVKKAINNLKKQVTPEMKMELGGDLNLLFGKDVTPTQFLNTWEIIHPTGGVGIGERLLNEQGVKGIKYLDNMSRDGGKGTSNFVVFDPTDVKILEKNNQSIEGLLD